MGAWDDASTGDIAVVSQMMGISYDTWIQKARDILHAPESPLSVRNGVWRITGREDIWRQLGSRVLDQDLDTFKSLAVAVLKAPDPAFELPAEERSAARLHGKEPEHSHYLREGIADGLALLGSQATACTNCSIGKVERTCVLAIREILTDAHWTLWGSLNHLLPSLAEAAPAEFVDNVEAAVGLTGSPFDELFSQEGMGITGQNYLTGLLWALEGLAWEEQNLVRVCVLLGELAGHDPGGQWANRPANSLATILVPWLPQTLAPPEKRRVAVQRLLDECPAIGWRLVTQLLPGEIRTSSGSHKPVWRKTIPDTWEGGVTRREYWEEAAFYSELAVKAAGEDVVKLSELIDRIDHLSQPGFELLVEVLAGEAIAALPEEQRLGLWEHMRRSINRHRRFSNAKWALPGDLVTRLETVAGQLAPKDPFNLYQHLFSGDVDLFEESSDWDALSRKLEAQREDATAKILQESGMEGVIRFADSVASPHEVGHALAVMAGDVIEDTLFQRYLGTGSHKRDALVRGFIWRRRYLNGWEWCDKVDRSGWTLEQTGQFLACLPFAKEAWDRAAHWLNENEGEYWLRTPANAYQADADLALAINKLIDYGRPYAAIDCLAKMHHVKQEIDVEQCIRALLAAVSSDEPTHAMNEYQMVSLIGFLQSHPSVSPEDVVRVEWAYLPLLERERGAWPKLLESRLASSPDSFCEAIRLIYRSKGEGHPSKEPSEEAQALALNAWRLLHAWRTPPGTYGDAEFSGDRFREWLEGVKRICGESGHLEVALVHVGEVLVHSPPDAGGLWIDRAVAAALNDRDADDLRSGFKTGVYNSRGAHWVDPTGKPEKELAEQYRRKAEDVENAGFQRFAVALRELASGYEREAERVIDEQLEEDDDEDR